MQTNLAKLRVEGSSKVQRPSASKILKRKRLFRRLDASRKCTLVWVSGPAGSGKTNLVSSYIEDRDLDHIWYKVDSNDIDIASFFFNMAQACKKNGHKNNTLPVFTSENRLCIPEFSHKFFISLCSNFKERTVIVYDNYQILPEDIIFHELLVDAIDLLPENLQVVIISRQEPSSKFSRLKANRRINFLGWQDIRFTPKEFSEVVGRWGFEFLPEKIHDNIYKKMDGWIAGLLFMLAGTKKFNTNLQYIDNSIFEEIFSYFTEEVFNYLDDEIKSLLLYTSFLPVITPDLVYALTGDIRAGQTLSCLCRNNLFIEKFDQENGETYQYHPLFREYLQNIIVDLIAPEKITEIKRRTARLLLEEKQAEDAAELFFMARDYDRFIEIVVDQAPTLISEGRNALLEKWLTGIPAEKFQDNPWLSYWLGVCQQLSDPPKATGSFEKAFSIACDQKDRVCAYSALAGQVGSIIHQWHNFKELDPLLKWFKKHYDTDSEGLPCELRVQITSCMAEAAIIREPGNENLNKWITYSTKKVLGLKNTELSIQVYLVAADYFFWTGDRSSCMAVLEKIQIFSRSPRISSLSLLKSKCLEATMYAWFMADAEKCLQTVESALDIARATGIRTMDHHLYFAGAFGALIARRFNKMAEYLQKVETTLDNGRQHSFFCHHYLSAWYNITKGNFANGLEHAESAVRTALKTGHVFHKALGTFVLALVLFENGKFLKAGIKLRQFEKDIEKTNSRLMQYLYFFSKALHSLDIGKEEVGLKYLKRALNLGRREKYQGLLCWWNKSAMTRLSMKALEKKIEEQYVKDVICNQGIVPAISPVEIEQWPWPIKIFTLGRFEIVRDGKPVRFTGKAQQKPMAMLKALIALGGRAVSEEYLTEALWPDADGDMQHQSLATTLHRLRKILGSKDLIDFQGGHLSINSRYAWVDIWAFERLLSQAESEFKKEEEESVCLAAKYAEKAINLYKGGFLPQNSMDHWCFHLRERLKSRFLRGVTLLGRSYEKLDEREKAVDCYLYALEVDSMIEEFYQRLMICYHRMGRFADAVLVYKRCQKNLFNLLQVAPSSHTKSIYNNLLVKSVAPK
ncbi:BTAD domain-containing putative transcriptional regulator [Thermodesulfobacteriota bacterium]